MVTSSKSSSFGMPTGRCLRRISRLRISLTILSPQPALRAAENPCLDQKAAWRQWRVVLETKRVLGPLFKCVKLSGRMNDLPDHPTHAGAGSRVVCEATCIWSILLLLRSQEGFPNFPPPPTGRAGLPLYYQCCDYAALRSRPHGPALTRPQSCRRGRADRSPRLPDPRRRGKPGGLRSNVHLEHPLTTPLSGRLPKLSTAPHWKGGPPPILSMLRLCSVAE